MNASENDLEDYCGQNRREVAYGNPYKVIRENTNLLNVIVNIENGQVEAVS